MIPAPIVEEKHARRPYPVGRRYSIDAGAEAYPERGRGIGVSS